MTATELAGEPITAKLTEAPGNGAKIGGLKVTTENAWFAARPSGTEDVYKIYAESFRGPDHLAEVQEAAREVVSAALGRDSRDSAARSGREHAEILPARGARQGLRRPRPASRRRARARWSAAPAATVVIGPSSLTASTDGRWRHRRRREPR